MEGSMNTPNLDDIEDKLEKAMVWIEAAIIAVSAILLVGLAVYATVLYIKRPPNTTVSSEAPPKVCSVVGPMTIYC
jgi:hypothetical protein